LQSHRFIVLSAGPNLRSPLNVWIPSYGPKAGKRPFFFLNQLPFRLSWFLSPNPFHFRRCEPNFFTSPIHSGSDSSPRRSIPFPPERACRYFSSASFFHFSISRFSLDLQYSAGLRLFLKSTLVWVVLCLPYLSLFPVNLSYSSGCCGGRNGYTRPSLPRR